MLRFSAIHLSLFVWALSVYSISGFSVEDLLEQQMYKNIELRELLVSTERRMEALQQKNGILENLVIKMEIEARRKFPFVNELLRQVSTTAKPLAGAATTVRLLGDVLPTSRPEIKRD